MNDELILSVKRVMGFKDPVDTCSTCKFNVVRDWVQYCTLNPAIEFIVKDNCSCRMFHKKETKQEVLVYKPQREEIP